MNDEEVNIQLITQDGIQRLLAFLPIFTDSNDNFGEGPTVEKKGNNTIIIHSARLSKKVSEFTTACYDENFVQSFDWGKWRKQHESDLNSDQFIKKADLITIVKMLTTHNRADRFCEGHLLSIMKNGTFLKILNRLNEINSEPEYRAHEDKPHS